MTAVDEDLARTQQLPSLDEPPARSTDREAARARAAARGREEALAAEAATAAQPGPAPAAPAAPTAEPQVVVERRKLNTDKFVGAFGLFVLRLVAAAIMGVHGVQHLMNLSGTEAFFGQTMLPYANIFAIATAVGEVLIAVALIVGLLVRVAGLGMLAIGAGALVFVVWAPFHLFGSAGFGGSDGMTGERELLIAGVGLLFLCVGGGGWGVDRMFRSNKSKGLPDEEEEL